VWAWPFKSSFFKSNDIDYAACQHAHARPYVPRHEHHNVRSGRSVTGDLATWLARYARERRPGAYDEVCETTGVARAHWRNVLAQLQRMGSTELQRRWDEARTLLYDHGAGYNPYADPQHTKRPWVLSPIPLVVDGGWWESVAEGLAQRARLLEHVLADLYGPQRLLYGGELPPDIVFANPRFLRPCVGMLPEGAR
jgi:uncharacterized circularly permuted ATP-grasp superfamily protein